MIKKDISNANVLLISAISAISATIVTVFVTIFSSFFEDANSHRQSNVQLVELAIGIITKSEKSINNMNEDEKAIRLWAVETINDAAEIKIEGELKKAILGRNLTLPTPMRIPVPVPVYRAYDKSSNRWFEINQDPHTGRVIWGKEVGSPFY